MLKLNRNLFDIELDYSVPYWETTDEYLRSSLFDSDAWEEADDDHYCILTFDDIRSDFDSWTPEERSEWLGDDETDDYTVYDWIRDCMMNSLAIVKTIKRKEC